MREHITISDVRFSAAPSGDRAGGLLGWVSLRYGCVLLDTIAIRRARDKRLVLSFPERRDGYGGRHPIVRPMDDAARHRFEAAVFEALGMTDATAQEVAT